jgi:gas vesicle protein
MNENSNSEFGAFLAGFVIGGLVGAAVALILAPQSGLETRSQIAGKGQELREAGSERVHQVRDSAENYFQHADLPEDIDRFDAQEQARIILDSGRKQADSVADEAAENGSETVAAN